MGKSESFFIRKNEEKVSHECNRTLLFNIRKSGVFESILKNNCIRNNKTTLIREITNVAQSNDYCGLVN